MAILADESTRVAVQGITGKEGSFHAGLCRVYGTSIVAGVTPGRGGSNHQGIPVFDSVKDAAEAEGADTSLIFVPPVHAADAVLEAIDAEIKLIVCITEGIPALDMLRVNAALKTSGSRLIGPNCPGIISPGKCKVGIMPAAIHKEGTVGVISRSGTLTYEAVEQLTARNIGQSTCIGIGGDPIIGTTFIDALRLFQDDPGTEAVVMIGEIGGEEEEKASDFIASEFTKPVVGFIAGQTAPPGRRMGHAGAIISQGKGTAAEKMEKMKKCGILLAESPALIGETVDRLNLR